MLFVGSFLIKAKDASTGGQTFACVSLTQSSLSNKVDWVKIDTTITNKKRSFLSRALRGTIRLYNFIAKLIIYRPDFILLFAAHGWSFKERSWLASIAKKFGKKVILAPRSGLIENDVKTNPKFKETIYTALNNSDYLICQSKAWESFYDQFRKDSTYKAVVINNWLDSSAYIKLPIKESSPKNLFFLGRITQNKGIFDLVEAFAPICEEYDLTLSIAGKGEAFDQLEKEIVTKNLSQRIKLLGWVHGQEKNEQLKKADILILPSYKEGYPNSLLEAMVSGVPAIASNVGSIPEIIEHKKSGYLIEPGNVNDIQEAIIWYVENQEQRLEIAHNARKSILEKNSLDNAVGKFEKILLA